ncbi:MAG TPA: LysR family transcriptional regulator [Streptosporangiaceae bacterium]|jgi:DNA-binding transcriptional LysR family regulator
MGEPVPELEARQLRYFVALAEERHFGRAGNRLGIAQPPLSRAIRQLERRLGVALLERSSRGISLTAAGEVLLAEGSAALAAITAATRHTQRAGLADPHLVLAMKPGGDGGLLPAILAEYERQPGAIPVDIIFSAGERTAMLRDGRADVGLLHSPHNDLSGLDSEELRTETQVVLLADHHPLTQQASVTLAELAGETMPRWPGTSQAGDTRPVVHDIGQLMQLITLRRLVAVVPASVRSRLPPGLTCRPVPDAPLVTIRVAWPRGSTSQQVASFVRAAGTAASRGRAA